MVSNGNHLVEVAWSGNEFVRQSHFQVETSLPDQHSRFSSYRSYILQQKPGLNSNRFWCPVLWKSQSLKSSYVRISCSLIWTRRFIYYRAKPIVTGNTVQEDTRSTPFSLTSCEGAIWTRCGRWPFASGNISPCRRQLYMYLFSSFTRWPLQVLLTSHMTKHFFQATRSPETVTYDFPATGYLWC